MVDGYCYRNNFVHNVAAVFMAAVVATVTLNTVDPTIFSHDTVNIFPLQRQNNTTPVLYLPISHNFKKITGCGEIMKRVSMTNICKNTCVGG